MTFNMGKCPQCQADNAYLRMECHVCGARLPWADAVAAAQSGGYAAPASNDEPSFLLAILGFFCWPAGIIVWALQRDQYPRRSASALNGAIASWVVGLALFGVLLLLRFSARPVQTVFTSASNTIVGASPGVPYRPFVQPTNAPLTPTPKPSPKPKPASLYHRINLKMSYEEVVKSIGRKEDRKRVAPDAVIYIWKTRPNESDAAHRGTTLEVTFNEGSISHLLQH